MRPKTRDYLIETILIPFRLNGKMLSRVLRHFDFPFRKEAIFKLFFKKIKKKLIKKIKMHSYYILNGY